MARVRGFILSHFSKTYFLIFLPFFSILSIVYIIRISILSSKFVLNGSEILDLYGFFLPDILFYTLPLSFIASLTATFTKLSHEHELIALFSFGLTPTKLRNLFILPALLFSILMLIISLYTIPQSTLKYKLFIDKKATEAKLSIIPDRLGQRFGDYMVFLGDKQGDHYQDIVLFATDNKQKRVIVIANDASMENNQSKFSLTLNHGTGDTFLPDSIASVQYKQMKLYSYPKSRANIPWLSRGWSKIYTNKRDMALLIYNIFLSLSPLLVLGMIAAFSIIHPRYQKSYTYLTGFGVSVMVYVTASLLRKQGTPLLLLSVSLLFLLLSALLFRYKTKAHF